MTRKLEDSLSNLGKALANIERQRLEPCGRHANGGGYRV